ncbi:hypothetical protein ACLMJK_009193 [Lecanora helva]
MILLNPSKGTLALQHEVGREVGILLKLLHESSRSICIFWTSSDAADNLAVYATPPVSPAAYQLQSSGPPFGQPPLGQAGGMEGDEQRRRQYEQSNYSRGYVPEYGAPGGNMSNLQHQDQFRHGQLLPTRTPTSMPIAAGVGPSPDFGAFAYTQGQQYQAQQMQAPSFPYQPEYVNDPQSQRFPQHPPQVMYNVPQSQSPYSIPQTQSTYDQTRQYQPRPAAATDVLSNQFGMPQQYYSGTDTPNTNTPLVMPQNYQTTPYQQNVQYNPSSALGRSTLASPYPSMPAESRQTSTTENPQTVTDSAADNNNRFYRAIREVNSHTYRSMLVQAGRSLLEVTDWLLRNAGPLGLTRDDHSMHAQRLALWDNFNNSWLALLQRQLDDTQAMLNTGRSPVPPKSLLSVATLETMGDQLVAHCDTLGRSGLVDYQMGVSEEEIINRLATMKTIKPLKALRQVKRREEEAIARLRIQFAKWE